MAEALGYTQATKLHQANQATLTTNLQGGKNHFSSSG